MAFFEKKNTDKPKAKVRKAKAFDCVGCGFFRNGDNPRMRGFGDFEKEILLIGEHPSELDDSKDTYWTGGGGRMLKSQLSKLGIDVARDCYSINAINCLPDKKDNGEFKEIKDYNVHCCRNMIVSRILKKIKPKLIICFGDKALLSIIGDRWKKALGGIGKWRGYCIPDQDLQAWVCPVYAPSFVLHNNPDIELIWKKDLTAAIDKLDLTFPVFKEPKVHIIDDLSILPDLAEKSQLCAIDFETTGKKPHAEGHKVVAASIAFNADEVYAFMMPESRRDTDSFTSILEDKKIAKIAQNMKMEDSWSYFRLNAEVRNWLHDTMLGAHTLDNRKGVTGLKFMAYVIFGIVGYDDDVSAYLDGEDEEEEKGANAFNKILELVALPGGKEKLLKYCGWDSVITFRIFQLQEELIYTNSKPF